MRHTVSFLICLFIIIILMITGCSRPVVKIQKPLPPIVKQYENVTYYTGNKQIHDTGVYLTKGEFFSILTADIHLRNRLVGMIGIDDFGFYLKDIDKAYQTGKLYLENINKSDRYVNADIIVWEREDYVQISDFLMELKEIDPDNSAIRILFLEIERLKDLYIESKKASVEIEETKKKIEELKKEEKTQLTEPSIEKNVASVSQSPAAETDGNDEIASLETRLAKLTETLLNCAVR